MIYEIRNYHFKPDYFEAYKKWARTEALPYLSRNMDIIGFWVNTDEPSDIKGQPQDNLGSANITWIIRWQDKDQCKAVFPVVVNSPEWKAISAKVPGGPDSYLRIESKFAETLL